MLNQYKFIKTLGKGSFGKVKLVEREIMGYKEMFAIKIFKKSFLKKRKEFYKDK
jgi:serine/threonine protein kinase